MTSAVFTQKNRKGSIVFGMSVSGHAMYAAKDDVVCAACSMLAQALYAGLLAAGYDAEYMQNNEQAAVLLQCEARDPLAADCIESMFTVARAGFELLAKNYPKNVCVTGATEKTH